MLIRTDRNLQTCRHVLGSCGIHAMSIGKNVSNVSAREVHYYGPDNPHNLDPQRMDSHGGWIASPSDLVSFALHVDRFPSPPDILRGATEKGHCDPYLHQFQVCKGLGGEPLGQLVARRRYARNQQYFGADCQRYVLGGHCKHSYEWGHRHAPVEDGQMRSVVACLSSAGCISGRYPCGTD